MKGVPRPNGTLWIIYRPRYPFDIETVASYDVDPRDWEPRWPVSDFKRRAEIDPDSVLDEMPLYDVIRIWTNRYAIYNSRGKHDLFEVFCHLVFPKKEERPLAYIAIWLIRDRLTKAEITRRLGKRGKRKIHPATLTKWVKYINQQIYNFTRRTQFKRKFANEVAREMELDEEQQLQTDVREIVNG
jgi:hypothetical protein